MADNKVGAEISLWLLRHYVDDIALLVLTEENYVFNEAIRCGVPCILYSSISQICDFVESQTHDLDIGFLLWWPHLITDPLLHAPRLGFVNTHPSYLPHNRGKHYNFWALVEQRPFGVSLHKVDAGIDSGDIVAQRRILYDWTDTGETMHSKAVSAMVDLFKSTYPGLRALKFSAVHQNLEDGSFHLASELDLASKIKLDEMYRARELLNLLRARTFEGYPGCWFDDNGEQYEVRISIRKKQR